MIAENVRRSRVNSLHKAAELLQAHSSDLPAFLTSDPAGVKLPDFLGRLSSRLSQEQTTTLSELRSLDQNIEHIKNIVSLQQHYANNSGPVVLETLPIANLVEEAVRLTSSERSTGPLSILRHYAEVPVVSIEKHKTLQILVRMVPLFSSASSRWIRKVRITGSTWLSRSGAGKTIPPR